MKKNNKHSKKEETPKKLTDFIKFPRTHHLIVLSKNVDRDDLFMDKTEAKPYYTETVTIEEKIDGANLGLSLDPETLKILAQNRSHHITSKSATHWKGIDTWIDEHKSLYDVLSPHFILFGEWVYAKHSVAYDKLPGYFIAFDIYDKKNQKFLSIQERNKKLKGTEIPIIKTIATGKFTKEEYLKFLETSSFYKSKGNLEGIYLRIDEGDFLKQRCKIVREDFIQQIEQHWSTMEIEKNTIDFEAMYNDDHYSN
eukprot:gene3823-6984_t